MGYYIETDSAKGKAEYLIDKHEAEFIDKPVMHTGDFTTVCVVDNGSFEAAAIIYDKKELEEFSNFPGDFRPRKWLKMPTIEVIDLCPRVAKQLISPVGTG